MTASAIPPAVPPSVQFDATLIRKLNPMGPGSMSYPSASYPGAERFSGTFGTLDYQQAVAGVRARGARHPLSLYLHIPFCATNCYYCGCSRIVTKDRRKAATYVGFLKREIEMQGKLFAGMNQIEQLHVGGGTPTYLSDAQMDDLMAHLRHWFQFAPDDIGEYSIEADPRTVTPERIHVLRSQGFNRISLGVQDFDPEVQKAVNRVQPEQHTLAIIEAARDARFRSVSVDLIYGLPKQTVMTVAQTLSKVIAADPDRIAVYNYAHRPHLFKPQRRIAEQDLPGGDAKLDMLYLCIKRLTEAGYVYIGLDHFAKPGDDLAVAQRQGRLHRNFQGYSTRADADLVACGVSAISAVGATYSQNVKTLDAYYEQIGQGRLPIARGIKLSMDDLLRRILIQRLMCNFELSIGSIELAYPIAFASYFAPELERLRAFEADGLVKIEADWLSVTLKGRLLIRDICMVFDTGRKREIVPQPLRYSKNI
jgi:oxygen-independent coproporphyrinogen III oxidase